MQWRTDSLQAVAFTMPGQPQPDALKLWDVLSPGESPEAFQKPTGAPNAITTANGRFGSNRLQLTSQFGRIDAVLTGEASGVVEEPPELAEPPAQIEPLADFLKEVGRRAMITRIGMVVSLSHVLKEGQNLSEEMHSATGGVPFPELTQDLIYQYNSQRAFGSKRPLTMNRMHTWSTGQQQLFTFGFEAGSQVNPTGAPIQVKAIPIVSYRLDANNVPSFPALAEESDGVIDELAKEAADFLRAIAGEIQ